MTDPGYKTKYCKHCDREHPATDQFWLRNESGSFRSMCRMEHNRRKRISQAEIKKERLAAGEKGSLLYLAVSAKWG